MCGVDFLTNSAQAGNRRVLESISCSICKLSTSSVAQNALHAYV